MAQNTKKHSSGFFEDASVTRKPPKNLDLSEVVTIDDDSDDDNNNAESSPDRHQAVENDQSYCDSDETDRRQESTSSDVVIVEEYPTKELEEIEELSRITSNGKFFFCRVDLNVNPEMFSCLQLVSLQ